MSDSLYFFLVTRLFFIDRLILKPSRTWIDNQLRADRFERLWFEKSTQPLGRILPDSKLRKYLRIIY